MSSIKLFRWLEKDDSKELVNKLNEYDRQVYERFNRNVKIDGNLDAQVLNVSFTGPSSELSIQTKYTAPPLGALLIRLINSDTGEAASVTWSWIYSKDGKIKTASFSSLASAKYDARILVLGA